MRTHTVFREKPQHYNLRIPVYAYQQLKTDAAEKEMSVNAYILDQLGIED